MTTGYILLWSGSSIPLNWHICDGTGGTPDLRGKFVYGKVNESDTPLTGGASSHSHGGGTVSSGGGAHTHTANVSTNAAGSSKVFYQQTVLVAPDGHSHSASFGVSSGGAAHTHGVSLDSAGSLPPYALLYYIMKVA